jgi:hypothetical protein
MSEPDAIMIALMLDAAEDLTARTLAVIDHYLDKAAPHVRRGTHAWVHRERSLSDLDGLRIHLPTDGVGSPCHVEGDEWPCDDACRYSDNLRRTAALYGVTP